MNKKFLAILLSLLLGLGAILLASCSPDGQNDPQMTDEGSDAGSKDSDDSKDSDGTSDTDTDRTDGTDGGSDDGDDDGGANPEQTPNDPEQTPSDPNQTPSDPNQTPSDPNQTPSDPNQTPNDPTQNPTEPQEPIEVVLESGLVLVFIEEEGGYRVTAYRGESEMPMIPSGHGDALITSIAEEAFDGCDVLSGIFFGGDEGEWALIDGIEILADLTVYFYSEEEPLVDGNYWYYEGDEPTKWTDNFPGTTLPTIPLAYGTRG